MKKLPCALQCGNEKLSNKSLKFTFSKSYKEKLFYFNTF